MKKEIEIFCTLGPSSLNNKFLKYIDNKKISLIRLNLSHIEIPKLIKCIKYLKKN